MAENAMSQTVTRNASDMYAGVLLAGAAFAGAAALWVYDHAVWAAIVGAFALLAAGAAFFSSGEAACPVCSEKLRGLGWMYLGACPECLHYFEVVDNQVREIAPDSVREVTVGFGIPVPYGACTMPAICCACGAPATRTVSKTLTVPNGTGPITVGATKFSIDMPHCARHDHGAVIGSASQQRRSDDPQRTAFDTQHSFFAIKVKSYAFYREFLRSNGHAYF